MDTTSIPKITKGHSLAKIVGVMVLSLCILEITKGLSINHFEQLFLSLKGSVGFCEQVALMALSLQFQIASYWS